MQEQLDPLQQQQQQQQIIGVVQQQTEQRSELAAHLTQDTLQGIGNVSVVSVDALKSETDGPP